MWFWGVVIKRNVFFKGFYLYFLENVAYVSVVRIRYFIVIF